MKIPLRLSLALLLLLSLVWGKDSFGQEMTVTPNRPGVANPADVAQRGVLEIEYGWERAFRGPDFKSLTALSGLLRFGFTEDSELRLGMENYLSQRSDDPPGRRSGIGDAFPGVKYRFLKQDGFWPTLAVSYDVKVPTASRKKGLGSGRVDHNLAFLAIEELLGSDWDLSYFLGWIGSEGTKRFDDSHLWALSFSRPLFGPLGISGEIYRGLRLNRETPGFVSTDWALTYTITPRVILDAGVDIGLNSAARDITFFAGVTIALIDLYKILRLKN